MASFLKKIQKTNDDIDFQIIQTAHNRVVDFVNSDQIIVKTPQMIVKALKNFVLRTIFAPKNDYLDVTINVTPKEYITYNFKEAKNICISDFAKKYDLSDNHVFYKILPLVKKDLRFSLQLDETKTIMRLERIRIYFREMESKTGKNGVKVQDECRT